MDLSEISITEIERINHQYHQSLLMSKATPFLSSITTLASDLFKVPIATILICKISIDYLLPDEFKVCPIANKSVSFYDYSLQSSKMFVVSDAKHDDMFKNNIQVIEKPYISFYCGYPIIDGNGQVLAILSLVDTNVREFKTEELNKLKQLGFLINNEVTHNKNENLNQLVTRQNNEDLSPFASQILSKDKIERTIYKLAQLFYSLNKPFGIALTRSIPTNQDANKFDAVISKSGQLLSRALRKIDSVGKWDNNHFLAVINCKDEGELSIVSERIMNAQKELDIEFKIGLILTNGRQSPAIFSEINKLLTNIDSNNNRIICL